jgi:periplasmic divalent cation tolerance protein
MGDIRIVYTTWPNPESAAAAAKEMVTRRLAACANVLPGVFSYYWWEGQVQGETELVVIFKTSAARVRELGDAIQDLHPYDMPAFVTIDIDDARSSKNYMDWVAKMTKPAG